MAGSWLDCAFNLNQQNVAQQNYSLRPQPVYELGLFEDPGPSNAVNSTFHISPSKIPLPISPPYEDIPSPPNDLIIPPTNINRRDPLGLDEPQPTWIHTAPKKNSQSNFFVPELYENAYQMQQTQQWPQAQPQNLMNYPIPNLNKHWKEELYKSEKEIQDFEFQKFGNDNVREKGITRRILNAEDKDLESRKFLTALNKIALHQPFNGPFCRALFNDTHVVFVGDSLVRGLYKDFVSRIFGRELLILESSMKKRNESSYCTNERLLEMKDPNDKREYFEFREYLTDTHWVQFLFTTRIYNDKVEQLLAHFEENRPDVVILHSNIWDSTRYSNDDRISLTQFALRLGHLCQRLKEILDPTAVVIFVLLPPAAYEQATTKNGKTKGFLSETHKEMNRMARFVSAAVNYFAAQIMAQYGFDVLDLNYYFQQDMFTALRAADGLHYTSLGVQIMTQTLIGHIIKAWDVELPNEMLEKLESLQVDYFEAHEQEPELFDGNDEDLKKYLDSIPECYCSFFKMNKELWKKIEHEKSPLPQLIKEYRATLLKNMKNCVKDQFLKQFVLEIKSEVENSNVNTGKVSAQKSGPSSEQPVIDLLDEEDVLFERDIVMLDNHHRPSSSNNIETKSKLDNVLSSEHINFFDQSEPNWEQVWTKYFEYAAQVLGISPDLEVEGKNEEQDSDIEIIGEYVKIGDRQEEVIMLSDSEDGFTQAEAMELVRKLFS
uniref:Uncharacterized protein n=1 Tax=Acrobeloides nanus TaxID=290746 RepID=A0A914C3T0_9BILA